MKDELIFRARIRNAPEGHPQPPQNKPQAFPIEQIGASEIVDIHEKDFPADGRR